MQVFVSCPFGLSSLLNNELKKLGMKPYDSFERGSYVDTDKEGIYKINIRSRIANKVYVVLGDENVFDFDELFDLVKKVNWVNYIHSIQQISISVVSKNSKLDSIRTIQSVSHKSIIEKMKISRIDNQLESSQDKVEIQINIQNNKCKVMVNSSGNSLFKRGYRTETGDAPIKENLAAGIILMSGWRFKDLLVDPFCGSGTILIEAAMIAKNIAPGLDRHFAFEHFGDFDKNIIGTIRDDAKNKVYEGDYKIKGFDIDNKIIDIAKKNIFKAKLNDIIDIEVGDFFDVKNSLSGATIISNPPYGKRMNPNDLHKIYDEIINCIKNNKGGFISSFTDLSDQDNGLSKKILFNGAEECGFWKKK